MEGSLRPNCLPASGLSNGLTEASLAQGSVVNTPIRERCDLRTKDCERTGACPGLHDPRSREGEVRDKRTYNFCLAHLALGNHAGLAETIRL